MNPCVFIIISVLLLLVLVTTTASQLAAVGGDDDNGVIMNKCLEKERLALLHFKAHVLQDPFDTLSSWTADDDECCQWGGVWCSDQTGQVTKLELRNCGLVGEVSHSLVNLTHLISLDLSGNSFHGTIPKSIGSLTKLSYLNLGYNRFNGTIPSSIGSLTELTRLDLSRNSLYGTIPRSIGSLTKLSYLDLFDNSLSGTIPPEIGNLTNLQALNLASVGRCVVENPAWLSRLSHLEDLRMDGVSLAKANYWIDAILSLRNLSYLSLKGCELSQVMYPYSSSFLNSSSSSIQTLYLGNNNLTSSMYPWLFVLTSNKLYTLDLSGNMLDGVPKYHLCGLSYLDFHNNSAVVNLPDFLTNLSGCASHALGRLDVSYSQFTGSLPDDIQKFSSLVNLDLSHNHLKNGSISEKLWELPELVILDVSFNNLTRFPTSILTLKKLTHLDLSNTGISDTIPLEFWDMWLTPLDYLNLSSNNISGEVPDLLSKFGYNSVIDLSSNRFYGPVPNVSSQTIYLNLSRNKFSGGISFLCQIVYGSLLFLDLSHNSLIGQLPDCLLHFTQLIVLNLGHNNLFGRLPPSIGSLIQLEVLYLYNNNFSGELPLPLKNCTSLKSLNLGANKFSGNVPIWVGENLSGLYVLILRSNNFFGTIPLELCHLANLQILDLSVNNLHGTIPSCLSNLTSMVQQGFSEDVPFYTSVRGYKSVAGIYVDHAMIQWQGDEREFLSTLKLLKSIDLSSNNLTGLIPYEITNLSDLIALNLSKNALSGEIPQKIGEMKKLVTLDLSRNNLSGRIPSSMSQMSLLNYLDLSFNNLSDRIPSSTQLQSFEPSRYDGNTWLCGPPLTKNCPGDGLNVPPVVSESEGNGEEEWGWLYIGGGMGFATGFWIACGALLLNRRGRRAFSHFYDSFKDWVYVKVVVFIANLQKARQT